MTRTIAGLLLGLMVMISGCSDKDSVPKGVLSHDKMEEVMWDVIEAEQYASNYLVKDTPRLDLKMENLRMYDEIFRLHQTSREQFSKSYQYYMGRADLAQALFDSLMNKGNRLRSESYSRPSRTVVASPPLPARGPLAAPAAGSGSAPAVGGGSAGTAGGGSARAVGSGSVPAVGGGSAGTVGSGSAPAGARSTAPASSVTPGSGGTPASTVKPPGSTVTPGSGVKPGSGVTPPPAVAPGLIPGAGLRDSLLKRRFPGLSPKRQDSLIRRGKLPS